MSLTRENAAIFEYEGDEYGVISDKRQFTLFKVVETGETDEEGRVEIRKQSPKFYRTLGALFQGLYRQGIRTSDYSSLEELQENVERCSEQVTKIIKKHGLMMKPIDVEINVQSS